jgi:hypothetical protein
MMKKTALLVLTVVGLLAFVGAAFAQPPPGGGPGGPGGGPGRGGMGMFGGMAFGTIQIVGDNGATLAIQSAFPPGNNQLSAAKLDANTKMVEYADCDVAQIKIGDIITVAGMPLKMRADDIQVGGPVTQFMTPPAPPGGQQMFDPLAPTATGQLTGKVTVLQPLTVDVNGVAIEIETTAKTTVIKQQPIADAGTFKANQKVLVIGQRDQANNIAARLVILDSTAGGLQNALMSGMRMGMGMGGGRRGGGGPPGGGAPPAGGPLPAPGGAQ